MHAEPAPVEAGHITRSLAGHGFSVDSGSFSERCEHPLLLRGYQWVVTMTDYDETLDALVAAVAT